MMSECPGTFAGLPDCMAACATFTDTNTYTVWYRPAYSVSCALYGAGQASINPTANCANASCRSAKLP